MATFGLPGVALLCGANTAACPSGSSTGALLFAAIRLLLALQMRLAEDDAALACLADEYKNASENWRRRRIQLRADEAEERRDQHAQALASAQQEIARGPSFSG